MPSRVTLPFIQCHQTRGLAACGGEAKPSSKAERVVVLEEPTPHLIISNLNDNG